MKNCIWCAEGQALDKNGYHYSVWTGQVIGKCKGWIDLPNDYPEERRRPKSLGDYDGEWTAVDFSGRACFLLGFLSASAICLILWGIL